MKKCCIKNIPTYHTKPMYCKDCGTKFEANYVKVDLKELSNLPTKYCKNKDAAGNYSYRKLKVKKAQKRNDVIVFDIEYEKISIVNPPNEAALSLSVCLYLDQPYKVTRHIESLIELGSTEAMINNIQTSIIYGDEITEQEYEEAKAKALAILDFAKSNA